MDAKAGVYACLRCKSRKIKCDHDIPKCAACKRAKAPCLTIDPASGRQIPRGYVAHLENRVNELEAELLRARHASAHPAQAWAPENDLPYYGGAGSSVLGGMSSIIGDEDIMHHPRNLLHNHRRLPTELPTKEEAEHYIKGFYERCNAMVPVLHREQFIREMYEPVYGPISPGISICSNYTILQLERSAAEPQPGTFYRRWADSGGALAACPEPEIQVCLFFLYIVFALAIVTDKGHMEGASEEGSRMHAAAMCYYRAVARDTGTPAELLRSLQALLLRAIYGLVVPSHPSAWYATGMAMRMCTNMGLHNETRVKFAGEHDFLIDMRRRLFWSAYYLDRLVGVYLGRPVNLGEEYIQCELPSMADDSWLLPPEEDSDEEPESVDASRDYAAPRGAAGAEAPTRMLPTLRSASSTSIVQGAPRDAPPDRPSYKWVFFYALQLRRIQHAAKVQLYDRADFSESSNIREIRDRIVSDLEEWHDSLPNSNESFNFNFSIKFFEVNYYYTLMLLFRSSRGIPNPTVAETRRMLNAGTRVLTMYVQFHDTQGFVYSWAAVHNVLHASSSCLFGLYRTNLLDEEYDLNAFDYLMEQIMIVVDKLKTRYDASPSDYGPLHTMMRVTLDFLRSRVDEPWRKRAKLSRSAADAPAACAADASMYSVAEDAATMRSFLAARELSSSDADAARMNQAPIAALPQGMAHLNAANYAQQTSQSSLPTYGGAPRQESLDKLLVPPPAAPVSAQGPYELSENTERTAREASVDEPAAQFSTYQGLTNDPMLAGSVAAAAGGGGGDGVADTASADAGMPQMEGVAESAIDPMRPLLVPREVSESLAPIFPGFTEDGQCTEFQMYDLLDDMSLYFDGYPGSQAPRPSPE